MSEIAPETRLWNLMRGTMSAKALGIAADLDVADALARGPRSVRELAQENGADPATLQRILRALASDGVFAEEEPGVFRNTEASELLRSNQPGNWPAFSHLFGDVFLEATAEMDPRTIDATFQRRYGIDFWSWLAANPEQRATFDLAMAGGKDRHADRLAALDWRDAETVVDVGGGNGALLRALLARRPELRGVVFDLPETVRDEADFGDRLSFFAGSFFEEVPPADTYILSAILHDWNDERATQILRTIRAAAGPESRLLIVDGVIQPGNEPNGMKWLDLLMLVIGGKERTEPEWRSLLDSAGFVIDEIEDGLIQASCR
jgi:O-methyltransferase domain/Dimerisation domain